jgi:hypothetical protein
MPYDGDEREQKSEATQPCGDFFHRDAYLGDEQIWAMAAILP